jgi:mono/diheme cytochrome c family protein
MLTTRTPEAHAWAMQQFKSFISGGQFVPFRVDKQTVVFPGFDGGGEWGGPAVDTRTGVIYVNANDIAWTGGLTENKTGGSLGFRAYQSQCSVCHGGDRKGSPPTFPSLIDEQKRLSDAQATEVIHNGKGRMPSFPNVQGAELASLLEYVETGKGEGGIGSVAPMNTVNRNELVGGKIYENNCALCHGDDLLGAPSNYPGLLGVRGRLSDQQILDNIRKTPILRRCCGFWAVVGTRLPGRTPRELRRTLRNVRRNLPSCPLAVLQSITLRDIGSFSIRMAILP